MPSGDLADEIGATRSGTSQHLSVLKNEGLLNARSDWQYVHYSLGNGADARLHELIALASDPGYSTVELPARTQRVFGRRQIVGSKALQGRDLGYTLKIAASRHARFMKARKKGGTDV